MYTKLLGKYLLTGKIAVVTGLHIGGSTVSLEIGGLDNPVIKDPLTDVPIIPGSSLKGKLRSLTEWRFGLIERHPKHGGYQAYSCDILQNKPSDENRNKWDKALILARLYGPATDNSTVRAKAGPTRLTVRDAFLTEESQRFLQEILGQGSFTEVKTENALDRVTSEANPRPVERVPAGSQFNLSLILDIFEAGEGKALWQTLFTALSMLEHSSLGGGGSRGSGQVKFEEIQITWRSADDYAKGEDGTQIELPGKTVQEILQNFDRIQWPA